MKVTNRNARQDRAGKHNDRNFNIDNAPHIQQDRMTDNLYYTYNGDMEHTFDEVEREFYELNFEDYIKKQNQKNEEHRHAERNRTISSYHRGRNTRPEDKILQIGNMKEHATKEELWECAMEYKEKFDDIFGEHCKILDMALHMDEATPHVHVRRVWIAEDQDGDKYVSQQKALEQMGITDPDQSRPNSKYNNPKISFTKTDTELFRSICIEKGLDIDIEPPLKREHLSTLEYKKQQISKDIESLEHTKNTLQEEIEKSQKDMTEFDNLITSMGEYFRTESYFEGRYLKELDDIRKKSRAEQFKILAEIYSKEAKQVLSKNEDFQTTIIRTQINAEMKRMENFIEEEGLLSKYQSQQNQKTPVVKTYENNELYTEYI